MAGTVLWITAFVDRPAATYDATERFWVAALGGSLSARRGDAAEFVTVVPPAGDAYVRVQRTVDGSAGSHIDLHVADPGAAAAAAVDLGASIAADHGGFVVLRSPGGLPFCFVAHHGESVRPAPVRIDDAGNRVLLDQLCIDAAPEWFDAERLFWSTVTGWHDLAARRPEFTALRRPDGMPIRLLLQRRGDDAAGEPTTCHLDFACDDAEAAGAHHVELGARVIERHRYWTVMADPSAVVYCLTKRDPDTGMLAVSGR